MSPAGKFYAQGVKANVIFFDKKPFIKDQWTHEVWIYDYLTNIHHTSKTNPFREQHLKDFIACYNPENNHQRQLTERFKKFTYDEIVARDKKSLDTCWLQDESLGVLENLPGTDLLAQENVESME